MSNFYPALKMRAAELAQKSDAGTITFIEQDELAWIRNIAENGTAAGPGNPELTYPGILVSPASYVKDGVHTREQSVRASLLVGKESAKTISSVEKVELDKLRASVSSLTAVDTARQAVLTEKANTKTISHAEKSELSKLNVASFVPTASGVILTPAQQTRMEVLVSKETAGTLTGHEATELNGLRRIVETIGVVPASAAMTPVQLARMEILVGKEKDSTITSRESVELSGLRALAA